MSAGMMVHVVKTEVVRALSDLIVRVATATDEEMLGLFEGTDTLNVRLAVAQPFASSITSLTVSVARSDLRKKENGPDAPTSDPC